MKNLDQLEKELQKLLLSFTEKDRAMIERRFGITLSNPPRVSDFGALTSAQVEELEREALKKLRGPE